MGKVIDRFLANVLGRGAVDSDEIGLAALDLLSKQFNVRRSDFQDTESNRGQVAATFLEGKFGGFAVPKRADTSISGS